MTYTDPWDFPSRAEAELDAELDRLDDARPRETGTGIVCSDCSRWIDGRRVQVRHASVVDVAACSRLTRRMLALAPR